MTEDVKEYLKICKELKNAESHLRGYMCPPDDDRDEPRIEAARKSVTAEIDELRAKIADTPEEVVARAREASKSYPCAGARDGCTTRVRQEGSYCRRCAFDEE